MFCCACAGNCNHVGNHSFCSAHGDRPQYTEPVIQWVGTFANTPCDHCLCREPEAGESMGGRTVPHKRCCHCLKLYAIEEEND